MPPPPPLFRGASLPVPPAQSQPWTPPETELPAAWIEATRWLFEHGLPDPRGCEYRDVDVVIGSVWGGAGKMAVHAWVLPAAVAANGDAAGQQFAVCWNGLVYPVWRVGEPADFAADLKRLSAVEWGWLRYGNAAPESRSVQHESPIALKVCYALRLGAGAEAARIGRRMAESWLQDQRRIHEDIAADADPQTAEIWKHDPFTRLAREWLWAGFDRTVCAHMRGDDRLALLAGEQLAAQRSALDNELRRRLEAGDDPMLRHIQRLEFLSPLDRLLADQRRRTVQPAPAEHPAPGAAPLVDPVADLIRQFDEIRETQDSQPGWVSLSQSDLLQQLKPFRSEAIAPLLDALARDDRLTRSVAFHRDFHTDRHLMGADEAAFAALRLITETRSFGPLTEHGYRGGLTPEQRAAVVQEVRQYCDQRRDVTVERQWFLTLQDDAATDEQWTEAAKKLTVAAHVRFEGGLTIVPQLPPGVEPPLRGESLRVERDPSLTELLIRRSDQIGAGRDPERSPQEFDVQRAIAVAQALVKWEPATAGPVLQRRQADCLKLINDRNARIGSSFEMLDGFMADIASAAIRVGDAAVVKGYCAWLQEYALSPIAKEDRFDLNDTMAPLWKGRDLPAIQQTSELLFHDERSRWNPLHRAPKASFFRVDQFAESPLLAVEPFRRQLLRLFDDQTEVGEATLKENGSLNVLYLGGGVGTSIGWEPADPRLPERTAEQPIRVCDLYAWGLSKVRGAPRFELIWPPADRDAALVRMRNFLKHWGGACVEGPGMFRDPQARIAITRLDHPATPADVAAGRAIFALETDQPVQVVPLDRFPQAARWKTLMDPRLTAPRGIRKPGEPVEYDQSGYVWQAERVGSGDTAKVFYGFVGRHVIERVPAEAIELLTR